MDSTETMISTSFGMKTGGILIDGVGFFKPDRIEADYDIPFPWDGLTGGEWDWSL